MTCLPSCHFQATNTMLVGITKIHRKTNGAIHVEIKLKLKCCLVFSQFKARSPLLNQQHAALWQSSVTCPSCKPSFSAHGWDKDQSYSTRVVLLYDTVQQHKYRSVAAFCKLDYFRNPHRRITISALSPDKVTSTHFWHPSYVMPAASFLKQPPSHVLLEVWIVHL